MYKKGRKNTLLGIGGIVLVFALIFALYSSNQSQKELIELAKQQSGQPPVAPVNQVSPTAQQTNIGEASTLTFDSFTGTWGQVAGKTEVYPNYYVVDKSGNFKVDAAGANTTSTFIGNSLTVYTQGAGYVMALDSGENEPTMVTCDAPNAAPDACQIKVYDAAESTDWVIVVEDENKDALTADDNANNTADYAGGNVGTSDTTYFVKMKNNAADESSYFKALCTYYTTGQEADDYTLDGIEEANTGTNIAGVNFAAVKVPDTLINTNILTYDDDNSSTTVSYKHCYEFSPAILLHEGDWVRLWTVFDPDDTTQPSANGDTHFGGVFFDAQFYKDENGVVQWGWVSFGDNTEDPGAVGIDENPDTTWNGLDVAYQVEPQ